MFNRILLVLALLALLASAAAAQGSRVVTLGGTKVAVRGKVFNQVDYVFTNGKGRSIAYYFVDRKKKMLEITEVGYDEVGGKLVASTIDVFRCPLDKIDADGSYNLEMESDSIAGAKYFRLTLLATGKGIDDLNFVRTSRSRSLATAESKAVNNVTINIIARKSADDWLRVFTGLGSANR